MKRKCLSSRPTSSTTAIIWEREFPNSQVSTVAELLEGKQPELPGRVPGFARAPRPGGRGRQIALSELNEN